MQEKHKGISKTRQSGIPRIYFCALSLAGLVAFLWLAILPTDAKGAWFIGYSPFRMLLFGILFLIATFFGLFSFKNKSIPNLKTRTIQYLEGEKSPAFIPFLSISLFFISTTFFLFFPIFQNGKYLPYFQRLAPFIAWLLFFSIITPLVLFFARRKLKSQNPGFKLFGILLLILTIIFTTWAIISVTKLGITPDSSYWDDHKPVPLMEGQLFLVFWIGLISIVLYFFLQTNIRKTPKTNKVPVKWLEIGMFVLIWFSAILVWMQLPVPNSYFTPPVKPPNNEVYPYSDARIHDSDSLGILLGEVNASQRIIRRPLYAIFLAGLHVVGGNNYSTLILLQTIVLGLVPALVYLIVNKLGNRLAGILAAVFVILVELNTLDVASLATTSNTKLLMTEWPAMLLLVVLVLFLVMWAKNNLGRQKTAILIGGSLGALILLRSQSLILIPFILLIFLVFQKKRWRDFLFSSTLFILTILIMITPLLIRNWQIIGKITFEDPRYTQAVIQRFENQEQIGGIPQQEALDESNTNLFGSAIQFMLKNPLQYAGFVTNNFLHNEILDVFIFPVRSLPIDGLNDLFNPKVLFWLNANNQLQLPQYLLLAVYLFILSIGIASAFTHWRITGLIPLIIHLAYNFSNAVSRISGWRFILPVQWVILVYFALGMIQVLLWFIHHFQIGIPEALIFLHSDNKLQGDNTKGISHKASIKQYFTFIPFLIIGLLIPLTMTWLPIRYANQDRDLLFQQLSDNQNWKQRSGSEIYLQSLKLNEQISITKGKAFYPRFYQADDGEPGLHPGIYKPEAYPRLIFLLINNQRQDILLPMPISPAYFPNGSEVIVVGKQTSTGFETILVDVLGEKSALYFAGMAAASTNG